MAAGVALAEIDRELIILKRMGTLAMQAGKLTARAGGHAAHRPQDPSRVRALQHRERREQRLDTFIAGRTKAAGQSPRADVPGSHSHVN
jgi:hypothetical protein